MSLAPRERAPDYVALVLAAGASSRFGANKLRAPFNGVPLVYHAIRAARAAPVSRVLVVARPDLDLGEWEAAPPVLSIPTQSTALSASLKAGLAAAGSVDGVFVFLGDMPCIPHDEAHHLASLIGANRAALPRSNGLPGHPVLIAARAFPALAALSGDRGAGSLIKGWRDVAYRESKDTAVLLDIDRPEDLDALEQRRNA